MNASSITLNEGQKQKLIPTIVPEDTTDSTNVTWTSSNKYIVEVDENGYVKAISGGTAIITATSSNGLTATCEVISNAPIKTQMISGKIASAGNETEDIKIEVVKKDEDVVFTSQNLSGNLVNYNFNIPFGNYILRVSKKNHVTREYEISVNNSSVTQDIQIALIGDINGDGKVNIKDWNRLYSHVNETNLLTGYELLCADVNKDGKVNTKDWNRVYDHINETNPLW